MTLGTDERAHGAITSGPGRCDQSPGAGTEQSADALFREARRRRRRRWTWSAGIVFLALAVAGLTVGLGSGRPEGPPRPPVGHGGRAGATTTGRHGGGHGAAAPVPYSSIAGVGLADDDVGWVDDSQHLYVTTDVGQTWRTVTPPILLRQGVADRTGTMVGIGPDDLWLPLEDAFFLVPPGQSLDGSVRGEGIERSTDGGTTWTFTALPGCLQACGSISLSFLDPEHGFAATASTMNKVGTLFATSDGGATWLPVADAPFTDNFSILFTSPADGWALNNGGSAGSDDLLRTTDGGVSWESAPGLPSSDLYQAPAFFGTQDGVMLGRPGTSGPAQPPVVFTTDDGGMTWTDHPTPADAHTAVYVRPASPDTPGNDPAVPFAAVSPTDWVLFVGSAVFTTANAGLTWSLVVPEPKWPAGAVSSIVFSSATQGLAAVEPPGCPGPSLMEVVTEPHCLGDSVLMVTADGGHTWTPSITNHDPSDLSYFAPS